MTSTQDFNCSHDTIDALLNGNKTWQQGILAIDSNFFENQATQQNPSFLWIGCADSRAPESVITGSLPGSIFATRNIANQFLPDDDSGLSVLTHAIVALGVQHIIVVGHTDCGGVDEALNIARDTPQSNGTVLRTWLQPLADLAVSEGLHEWPVEDRQKALEVLRRINVRKQIANLVPRVSQLIEFRQANTPAPGFINITIHGWMYHVGTGLLEDLDMSQDVNSVNGADAVPKV